MDKEVIDKNQEYRCDKCGWIGINEELVQDDCFRDSDDVNCPKCNELFKRKQMRYKRDD